MKILIIEDHPQSAQILEALLANRGIQSECAGYMEDGIDIFKLRAEQGEPFDCVVTDLSLPDSDVEKTLKVCKEVFKNVPVRAISGASDPEVIRSAQEAGIPLISKGTSANGILESILHALADGHPSDEVFGMLASARPTAREIILPAEPLKRWFFSHWPNWVKTMAAVGTVMGMLGAAATMGGNLYKGVESRGHLAAQLEQRNKEVDSTLAGHGAQLLQQSVDIRKLQDSQITITDKLDEIARTVEQGRKDTKAQLDRIESQRR